MKRGMQLVGHFSGVDSVAVMGETDGVQKGQMWSMAVLRKSHCQTVGDGEHNLDTMQMAAVRTTRHVCGKNSRVPNSELLFTRQAATLG